MDDFQKLRVFNKLKSVYRLNSVGDRKESSAEHSWSCLVLADYFLSKAKRPLDRLKVYELLIYHDVVEIAVGDTPLHPGLARDDKGENELRAANMLREEFPKVLGDKFYASFLEFEAQETLEAKFAKAIDKLDAQIHELDYKADWEGWTKEFLVGSVERYFLPFPELLASFHALLEYAEEEGYFDR